MDTFKIQKISGFVSPDDVEKVMQVVRCREYQETGTRTSNMICTHEVGEFVRGVTVTGRTVTFFPTSRYLAIDFGAVGSEMFAGEILDWIDGEGITFSSLIIKTSVEGRFSSFEEMKEVRNAFYAS